MKSCIVILLCTLFVVNLYSDNIDFVNPFIGTGANGHINPGAVRPFGMVKAGPDTGTKGWDYCAGYRYEDNRILGFSHTHLNGTGIGDYLDILILPGIGEDFNGTGNGNRGALFSHDNETATPGYYSVKFDTGIRTEISTTCRSAVHRITYPSEDSCKLLIDTAHGTGHDENIRSTLKIVDKRRIEGLRRSRGWSDGHSVYFVMEFSEDITASDITGVIESESSSEGSIGRELRAVLEFDKHDKPLLARVGISSVSCSNAWNNLRSEQKGRGFEEIRREAESEWKNIFDRIDVKTRVEEDKVKFYTAMYYLYHHPSTLSDVDGRYRGFEDKVHRMEDGKTRYTVFSLWDTFRAVHPLFTILEPEKNGEFIESLLAYADKTGRYPVWELAGKDTGTMIAYHAVSVIADAVVKGYDGADYKALYKAAVNTALDEQKVYDPYILKGYLPWDKVNESVSRTLEHSYNDWCIALLAEKAGYDEDASSFRYMGQFYRNLFDFKTGFMRGRDEMGRWKEPFDPLYSNHRFDEYTEGNAWQYLWFVPHDVEGLIDLLGGSQEFCRKLDGLFNNSGKLAGTNYSPDISGMIGQYAHGNEPGHHTPYLYVYSGRPASTQKMVRKIMSELYSADVEGLCGNEDCGQLSAWYIFSSMGFYPVCPGKAEYTIGSPVFDELTMKLNNGNIFRIVAKNNSPEAVYIESITLNGEELNSFFIDHEDIMKGGELIFTMTSDVKSVKKLQSE